MINDSWPRDRDNFLAAVQKMLSAGTAEEALCHAAEVVRTAPLVAVDGVVYRDLASRLAIFEAPALSVTVTINKPAESAMLISCAGGPDRLHDGDAVDIVATPDGWMADKKPGH